MEYRGRSSDRERYRGRAGEHDRTTRNRTSERERAGDVVRDSDRVRWASSVQLRT